MLVRIWVRAEVLHAAGGEAGGQARPLIVSGRLLTDWIGPDLVQPSEYLVFALGWLFCHFDCCQALDFSYLCWQGRSMA
jgi:hypothetical protein